MWRYLDILRRQARPFRFLASRLLTRTGMSRYLTFARNGYRLRFHPTALSAALWVNKEERLREEWFLAGCLVPGDTVIDVGANIGTVSLACARAVGDQGHVLAIEPHPVVYAALSDNIHLNNVQHTVITRNAALGREAGTVFLTETSDDTQTMVSSARGDTKASTQLLPLDAIAPEGPVALIKMDVEGYEPIVLAGADGVCANTRMIYTEFDPALIRRHDEDPAAYLDLLRTRGFALFHIRDGRLVELARDPDRKDMLVALRGDAGHRQRVERAAVHAWGP